MLLSILTSIFLILSFPNFNLNYLVFIGFVPLFLAIEKNSRKKAFWFFYVSGFLFYLGTLYWLYHVTGFGLIVLCLYLALYFGVFGFLIAFLGRPGIFLYPAIWVLLEYIQSRLFTGFGWTLLGYSQYKNLPFIQIADFTGVCGVSFVIMLVNVAIWRLVKHKKLSRSLSFVALVLIAVYAYGFFRLNSEEKSPTVKVSIIQGNIPQEIKWQPEAREAILNRYITLTKIAAIDDPDLIIWPETSFPGFFGNDRKMTSEVLELAGEIDTSLLLGANTVKGAKYFNSALLISGKGEKIDKYDKIHLVPFGEYVPFSDKFPVLHDLVLGELGEFTEGRDFKIFELPVDKLKAGKSQVNFAALICFEDIFPELARKFVKNGADFLIVITNDAWYGRSGAPYQHAACSVFRAIENRVSVVRCANTGYSCFIDAKGRIYDAVEKNNTHLFVTGHKTSSLRLK